MPKNYYFFIFYFLFTITSVFSATTYYIDATNGNDSYSGTSIDQAWKSISKVNSSTFQPGDYILFKRGEIYNDTLEIPSSGEENNPIIFGSYGEGNKPIISSSSYITGWDNQLNWTQYSNKIWKISYEAPLGIITRLWLSGQEYKEAQNIDNIDEISRWYYDTNNKFLYIYSDYNPALTYSNIESIGNTPLKILGKDYITIKDLEFRGGYNCIDIYGSNHIIIENCNIGWGSVLGIWISRKDWNPIINSSDYGIIRNCNIDSGHRLKYSFDRPYPEDGIHLRDGARYWEIYNNTIKDWGHTGIYLTNKDINYPVSYNKAYSNLITAEDVSYCRGFAIDGYDGAAQYNEFYYNIVKNTTVRNQIGGDHNYVYYNIIDTVRNSVFKDYGTGQGISLGNWDGLANHDNKIFNNTIYNCDEAGIMIHSSNSDPIYNNEIKNNLIYNCGKNSKDNLQDIGIFIDNQSIISSITVTNNLIYKANSDKIISYRNEKLSVSEFNLKSYQNDIINSNIQINPSLISIENNNFMLTSTSPCRDAGINVSLNKDIAGTSVPQGTRPDIGAYEYILSANDIKNYSQIQNISYNIENTNIKIELPANSLSENFYPVFYPMPGAFAGETDYKKVISANNKILNSNKIIPYTSIGINLYNLSGNNIGNTLSTNAALTIYYPDQNNDGFIDSVNTPLSEKNISIYTLNENTEEWEKVNNSVINEIENYIYAQVPHFSVFTVIGEIYNNPAEIENIYVYPNPFRPLKDLYLTFKNIPIGTEIIIYNLSGEKIIKLQENSGIGYLKWDSRNSQGEKVASGIYFYYAQNGKFKKNGKIAIIK